MRACFFLFLCLLSTNAQAAFHNGFEIYHYLPANTWSAKEILSMSEDRHGITWIGTSKGLYQIKNTGLGHQPIAMPGFEQQAVYFIQEDPNGILWICTREKGLILRQKNHYSTLDFTDYGFPTTFKKNTNIACASLPGGDLYVLNCPNLYRFHWRSKKLVLEQKLDIENPGLVQQMSFAPDQNALYLVCKKKTSFHLYTINKTGLHKMDWPLHHHSTRGLARSLGQYELDLLGLRNDSLLISLNFDNQHQFPLFINHAKAYFSWDQQHQLQRLIPIWSVVKDYYQNALFPEKQLKEEESTLKLHKFLISKQGYWCFASNQGLFIVKPQNRLAFKTLGSTQGENILSLVSDGNERLWYATADGLFRHNLKKHIVHFSPQHAAIHTILPLRKDSMWVAYNSFDGLKMCLGENMQMQNLPFSQLYPHNFPGPPVSTPLGVWINSDFSDDLYCLHWPDARPLAHLKLKLNPSINGINTNCAKVMLWSKRDSSLWLGGAAGLFRIVKLFPNLNLAHQDSLPLPSSLRGLNVNALYEDVMGHIWIGTESRGLICYDPQKRKIVTWLQIQQGLPHQRVVSILGSHHDTLLWLGTQNGLGCFNTQTRTFTNFNKANGLPATEFNLAAACTSQNGNLYFGTTAGLVYFKPWIPTPHPYAALPYVSIESQNAKGQLHWYYPTLFEKINFKPNESNITIELFISDISIASSVLFRYNISGLTTGWREQTGSERLFFPQLAPGNYRMQVQALLPNGSLSRVFSFRLHKNAPWYRTTWFFILLALLLATLAYKFHQMRIEELDREHQLRKQVTSDLHDNLSSRIYAVSS